MVLHSKFDQAPQYFEKCDKMCYTLWNARHFLSCANRDFSLLCLQKPSALVCSLSYQHFSPVLKACGWSLFANAGAVAILTVDQSANLLMMRDGVETEQNSTDVICEFSTKVFINIGMMLSVL